jgi:C-terminal processing protease CtpA/Prc
MSAAQVGQNPFGDYAPQSTQIQGILKGMYDAFTADLEKDNAEEAEAQKSFEELMGTKMQEQKNS